MEDIKLNTTVITYLQSEYRLCSTIGRHKFSSGQIEKLKIAKIPLMLDFIITIIIIMFIRLQFEATYE